MNQADFAPEIRESSRRRPSRAFVPAALLAALLFSTLNGSARADFASYTFGGEITDVEDDAGLIGDPNSPEINLLNGLVNVGDPLKVQLDVTYDPNNSAFAPYTVSVHTPSWGFDNSGSNSNFIADPLLIFVSFDPVIVPGRHLQGDPIVTSMSIIGDLLTINGYTPSLRYGNPQFTVRGSLSSVPEPMSATLVLSGLSLVAMKMRRRKSEESGQ